jgi:hypothetical protein
MTVAGTENGGAPSQRSPVVNSVLCFVIYQETPSAMPSMTCHMALKVAQS